MQPIHYSFTMGIAALLIGGYLAWVQSQPMLFAFSLVAAYLLGAQTVGQFGANSGGSSRDDDPDDYQGTSAGFVIDDDDDDGPGNRG